MKSIKAVRKPQAAKPQAVKPSVKFDYIKGTGFKVIHADGIVGGSSPQGNLVVSFFSERFPIPTQMEYQVTPEGKLGPELPAGRVCRNALIRELDVSVIMSLETARALQTWLGTQISKVEDLKKKAGK